jgi:hypothetical protein
VDAGHLTSALRKAGVLRDGCVRDVELENPRDTLLSHIVRLNLTCEGAVSGAPRCRGACSKPASVLGASCPFIDQFGDRIPIERRELFHRLLDAAPRLPRAA